MVFHDGYGQTMDRNGWDVCKDQSKTVVVRITDACPCYVSSQYGPSVRVRACMCVCVCARALWGRGSVGVRADHDHVHHRCVLLGLCQY